MSVKPTWRVQIYDLDDALVYTITDELTTCSYTDEFTTGVGSFSFTVPAVKGFTNAYDDIGNHYKVKISPGYAGSYVHLFTGRITDFTTQVGEKVTRTFEGKGVGEKLERFLIKNRRWQDTEADDIVAELADASHLNLTTNIDADTTAETITVDCETYFDVLRKVSDYWYDGATQVKRDFGINKDDELFWRSRPLRSAATSITGGTADAGGDATHTVDAALTQANDYWNGCFITYLTGDNAGLSRLVTDFDAATDKLTHLAFPNTCDAGDTYSMAGVEAITNILAYNLKYSIINSKNTIQVLGAASAPLPVNYDAWTDSLDYWTATTGTLDLNNTSPKEGTYWVRGNTDGAGTAVDITLTFPQTITLRTISELNFWLIVAAPVDTTNRLRIYAPDSSNYFYMDLEWNTGTYWHHHILGPSNEYDADENPTGEWYKQGSPNWWNLTAAQFLYVDSVLINWNIQVDKFYFYPDRWCYTSAAEDATNQTNYGERQAEYTDDALNSTTQCQSRQETLLYQQKDRVLRLDFAVPGNTNIRLGDRLSITLPLDNLTAQSFDVVAVTQTYNKEPEGFQTTPRCLSTSSTRRLPPLTPLESIKLNLKSARDATSGIYGKIVR